MTANIREYPEIEVQSAYWEDSQSQITINDFMNKRQKSHPEKFFLKASKK